MCAVNDTPAYCITTIGLYFVDFCRPRQGKTQTAALLHCVTAYSHTTTWLYALALRKEVFLY